MPVQAELPNSDRINIGFDVATIPHGGKVKAERDGQSIVSSSGFFQGLPTNSPEKAMTAVSEDLPAILAHEVHQRDVDAVFQGGEELDNLRVNHGILPEWRPTIELAGLLMDEAVSATEVTADIHRLGPLETAILLHWWQSKGDRKSPARATAERLAQNLKGPWSDQFIPVLFGEYVKLTRSGLILASPHQDELFDQVTAKGKSVLQGLSRELRWSYNEFARSMRTANQPIPDYQTWLAKMTGDVDLTTINKRGESLTLAGHIVSRIVGRERPDTIEEQVERLGMNHPHIPKSTDIDKALEVLTHPAEQIPAPQSIVRRLAAIVKGFQAAA